MAQGERQEVFVSGYQQRDGHRVRVTVRLIVEEYSGAVLQAEVIPPKQTARAKNLPESLPPR